MKDMKGMKGMRGGHVQHGVSSFEREMDASMARMMQDMHGPGFVGQADIDFLAMMIPHHAGAVDMARLVLQHGRDPATRQLAEEIIAFPFYFPYMLGIVCLALGAFLLSGWKRGARPQLVGGALGIAVMITVFVNAWLYPEVTKIKQERSSFEKTAVDSPARKRFMDLHGISMILNLVLLADGIALIVSDSFSRREH